MNKQLPVIHKDRTATSVESMSITLEFVQAGKNFMDVSNAFAAAQDELAISVKWDRATNRGWFTKAEATKIRKHMSANV